MAGSGSSSGNSAAGNGTSGNGALLNLPLGYKFKPKDSEVLVYLKKKILGQELPADVIPTTDVYGTNPDELPFGDFKYGTGKEWFFFTTKPADELETADGYWNPSATMEIFVDDILEGFVQRLEYYEDTGRKTRWRKHEYMVNPYIFEDAELDDAAKKRISNLVVCKIFRGK